MLIYIINETYFTVVFCLIYLQFVCKMVKQMLLKELVVNLHLCMQKQQCTQLFLLVTCAQVCVMTCLSPLLSNINDVYHHTGAMLLYKFKRVVIGENKTFLGAEDLLRSHGVEVVVLQNQECISMMENFIQEKPELWNEDIGVDDSS